MTTTKPKTRNWLWAFSRRLGAQALLSATVMAGLHMASINGYGVRDLLPTEAGDENSPRSEPSQPFRVTGVPPRFDPPVQAGGRLESLAPKTPLATAAREPTGAAAGIEPARGAETTPSSTAAKSAAAEARPALRRIAVPTPRPAIVAAVRPRATPQAWAAVPDLPFDTSRRDVPVYDVAELVDPDEVPEPLLAQDRFAVGDLLPSGSALLQRTAAITDSAAHVVTGTASRIIDLVR